MDTSEDDPASHRREGDPARLIVSGSADFVANNVPFMLNLADWMLQDASLIRIRSKNPAPAPLEVLSDQQSTVIRAVNLLGGALLILMLGLARRAFRPKVPKYQTPADDVLAQVDAFRKRVPFEDDDTDEQDIEPGLPAPESTVELLPQPQPEPEPEPPEPEPDRYPSPSQNRYPRARAQNRYPSPSPNRYPSPSQNRYPSPSPNRYPSPSQNRHPSPSRIRSPRAGHWRTRSSRPKRKI